MSPDFLQLPMKTLILGLGNPILGDDGAGWAVAKALSNAQYPIPDIEIDYLSLGGLSLMERMIGYDRVILIDTLVTGLQPCGHVSCFKLCALPDFTAGHTTAAHDTSLQNALRVGQKMGAELPDSENIWIVGIEAQHAYEFSETLSPAIRSAIPVAVDFVLNILKDETYPVLKLRKSPDVS